MESKNLKYRLGRKQQRVVLTWDGSKEVTQFNRPFQHLAQSVVDFLNEATPSQDEKDAEIERLKGLIEHLQDQLESCKFHFNASQSQFREILNKLNIKT